MLKDRIELEKRAREFARWMILRMLYASLPGAASEAIIVRVLQDFNFECEIEDVRRQFDYLQSLGLATVGQDDLQGWWARLTAQGAAVVEYTSSAPPGIARPRRPRGPGL